MGGDALARQLGDAAPGDEGMLPYNSRNGGASESWLVIAFPVGHLSAASARSGAGSVQAT
jgi:hypothetical protein